MIICIRPSFKALLLMLLVSLIWLTVIPSSRADWFDKDFQSTWATRDPVRKENGVIGLVLTHYSGSGFSSKESWFHGYYSSKIKLHKGFSAGVITAFYLTSAWDPAWTAAKVDLHDEIDMEFLGNTTSGGIDLQTNWYAGGLGDHEERIKLWFDPAEDFHEYSIKWNWDHIVFFVDRIPIREVKVNNSIGCFPTLPMFMMTSLWEASKWATQGGKVKVDWEKQPFTADFKDMKIESCYYRNLDDKVRPLCATRNLTLPWDNGLSKKEEALLAYSQKHYKYYDFSTDYWRLKYNVGFKKQINTPKEGTRSEDFIDASSKEQSKDMTSQPELPAQKTKITSRHLLRLNV